MRPITFYEHQGCDTCRQARKFLAARGVEFRAVPIREQPPTVAELRRMLRLLGGNVRRLFNTSGLDYKRLKLSETLPAMSEAQALELLATNGNLVRRPFLLTAEGGAVGFKEDEWKSLPGL